MALAMFLYRRRVLTGIAHLTDRLRAEAASLRPGTRGGRAGTAASVRPAVSGGAGCPVTGWANGPGEAVMDAPGSTAYEAAHTGRKLRMRPARAAAQPHEMLMIVDRRLVAAAVAALLASDAHRGPRTK